MVRRPGIQLPQGYRPPRDFDQLDFCVYYYSVVAGRPCGSRAAELTAAEGGVFVPTQQRASLFITTGTLPFSQLPDWEPMPLRVDCYVRVFLTQDRSSYLDLAFVRIFKWLLSEESTRSNRIYDSFQGMHMVDLGQGIYTSIRFVLLSDLDRQVLFVDSVHGEPRNRNVKYIIFLD